MKPSVRLIAMTAPVHDAEDLELMGVDDLVTYVETFDPDAVGWSFVDMTFVVTIDPLLSGEFRLNFSMWATLNKPAADPAAGDLDTVVVKTSILDLSDTFMEAQYDPAMSPLVREVLGVMWDMVVVDFEDVFAEVNPRVME